MKNNVNWKEKAFILLIWCAYRGLTWVPQEKKEKRRSPSKLDVASVSVPMERSEVIR